MSGLKPHSSAARTARDVRWAEPLPEYGIENLHRITPQLWRSAQPRVEAVDRLRELGLRTVISFRAFNADDEAFRSADLKLIRVPINTWHIRDRHILRALAEVREAEQRGPVLIHCLHGADRTALVSAMYRIVMQGWSKDAARDEMLHGGFGYHTMWRNIPRYLAAVDPAAITQALRSGESSQAARMGGCTRRSASPNSSSPARR